MWLSENHRTDRTCSRTMHEHQLTEHANEGITQSGSRGSLSVMQETVSSFSSLERTVA